MRVSFTDDAGHAESLTSVATAAVAAKTAQLTVSFPTSPFQSSRHKGDDDQPQVIVAFNLPVQSFEQTTPSVSLTGATVHSVAQHQEEGLENAWIFWLDPAGEDDVVFTLVANRSCDGGGICTPDGRMLSQGLSKSLPGPEEHEPQADEQQPNSAATGLPSIVGTARVEETLTADTTGIADADGLDSVSFTYQWIADDSDIAGATGAAYTLGATDEGKAVKVRVSFTDDADNAETLTSAATDAVAAEPQTNSPATGAPTITGTAQVGETLTADTSGIADADGLTATSSTSTSGWPTTRTYREPPTPPTPWPTADEGKAIKVEVTFTDDAGNDESLTSAATDAVAAEPQTNSPATGAPAITGTARWARR